MDQKTRYIVHSNEIDGAQYIEWIAVRNEDNLLSLYNITGYKNRDEYIEQLKEIEKNHPGIMQELYLGNYSTADSEWFVNEEARIIKSKKEASPIIVEHINYEDENRHNIKDAVIGGLTVALAASLIALALKTGIFKGKDKAQLQNAPTTVEEEDETIKTTEDLINNGVVDENSKIAGKTIKELLDMLKDNGQKEAFTKISNNQKQFNEVAAPTVKMPAHEVKTSDENGNVITEYISDKQLFLTHDEVSVLYLYANAFEVPAEELAMYFGNAKIFDQKPNGKIKESLNQNIVTTNFERASQVINMYYNLDSKVATGISETFENPSEGKFYQSFEDLVFEYNATRSEKTAEAIRAKLQDTFVGGTLDSLKDEYPGATSIIYTTILPWSEQNGIIDAEKFEMYANIAQTSVCNDAKEQLRKIEKELDCKITDCGNAETKVNGTEEIEEELDRISDEPTLTLDRKYDMRQSVEGYTLDDLYAAGYSMDGGLTVESSESHTYSNESVTKSEAANIAGTETVKRAEEKAKAEFNKEYAEKQAAEEKRAQELIDRNEEQVNKLDPKDTGKAAYDEANPNPVITKEEFEEYFVPESSTTTQSEEVYTEETTVVTYTDTEEEYFVSEEEAENTQGKAKTR